MNRSFSYQFSGTIQNEEYRRSVVAGFDRILYNLDLRLQSHEVMNEGSESEQRQRHQDFLSRLNKNSDRVNFTSSDFDSENWMARQDEQYTKISGHLTKRIHEIRALRQIFADTAPVQVSKETLITASDLLRNLLLSLVFARSHLNHYLQNATDRNEVDAEEQATLDESAKETELDIQVYSLALCSLGDSNTPSFHSVYPFDEFDLL